MTLPVCFHCIIEGNVTTWDHNATIVICARHRQIEIPCPTCGGTGDNAACMPCAGAGLILSDKVLWAAEWLSLPYTPAAARQGEHWLSFMVLHATEADPCHWTVANLLEVFEGVKMLSQPGYPWAGERFAVLAQEAIIDTVTTLLRKEIADTAQKSALTPTQG